MIKSELLVDPIWEFILNAKLTPYINSVRNFWNNISEITVTGTGIFPIKDKNAPGLMYRVTNTPARSPIKNVQVFPFVPVVFLQLTNVSGGATRMVHRVCADNNFKIEEFTIIEKSNLPSTYHQGQFVAFVPTKILEGAEQLGKWVYLTYPEMIELSNGNVARSIKNKVVKYID